MVDSIHKLGYYFLQLWNYYASHLKTQSSRASMALFSAQAAIVAPVQKTAYTKADRVTGKLTDQQTPEAGRNYLIAAMQQGMENRRFPNVRAITLATILIY